MTNSISEDVVVVSGLPRSGTSMMMNMLQASGLPLITDGIRSADEDNPKGYFELERVKKLKEEHAWLADAGGHVVKVISDLLRDLPANYSYRVIFMRRKIDEILASQEQMLIRRGEAGGDVDVAEMKKIFLRDLDDTMDWLRGSAHLQVLFVSYNRLLEEPEAQIERIHGFLGGEIDASAMHQVIDKALYRNRS